MLIKPIFPTEIGISQLDDQALTHSVEPNLNRDPRVCLAFNLDYK